MEYMTKTEFAERIDVSKVTVFNWIKSDKNGIRRYTSSQGISTDIFTDPAWSNLDTKEGALTRAAQMKKELESWRQKAEGYKIDLDAMTRDRDEHGQKLDETLELLAAARDRSEQRQRDLDNLREKLDKAGAAYDELKEKLAATEAELKEQRAAYQIDMDAMRRERDEAKQEAARIRDLESRIASLEADKAFLQGQYQQQADMLARLTLPAPRRTFGQAVKDLLGIKSKQPEQ
ncbi:MAG: hypothetical protein IIZ93_12420 [Acidaminococcaceae bacterium]|nr:hypothetical protein [Acidaminococcaceae bacterium]